MKRHPFLLLLITCCFYPSWSQESEFLPGYILKHSGDTVYGLVKDRVLRNEEQLIEKLTIELLSGRKKKIKKGKVRTYKRGSDVFVRTTVQEKFLFIAPVVSKELFLIEKVSGFISIYRSHQNDYDSRTIDYVTLLKESDSNLFVTLPFFGFRSIIEKCYDDYPIALKKLQERHYTYAEIYEIIEECNRIVQSASS